MQAKQSSLCVGKWKPHLTGIRHNFIIILHTSLFPPAVQPHPVTHPCSKSTVFGVDLFAFNEATSGAISNCTKNENIVYRQWEQREQFFCSNSCRSSTWEQSMGSQCSGRAPQWRNLDSDVLFFLIISIIACWPSPVSFYVCSLTRSQLGMTWL